MVDQRDHPAKNLVGRCGAMRFASSPTAPCALVAAAVACLAIVACTPDAPPAEPRSPAFAGTIQDSLLTLDTHVDIPLDFATDAVDPLDADLQVNLQKMQAGGLDAAFFIVYVGQTQRTEQNYVDAQRDALTKFDSIHRMVARYPDWIELARSAADVERIAAARKLVAAIGIENGYVIGKDLDLLDRYHALGARYVTLVHNGHNDLAHSASPRAQIGDQPGSDSGGLTELGVQAVERMNRVGIMVDVSHASKQSALDAIRASRAPVIASHSSIRAVADHVRNLDDETLLALQANGGVVQVVAFDGYVKVQPPERGAAVTALIERLSLTEPVEAETLPNNVRIAYQRGMRDIDARWPPATVADFVDHIDHAVELIGIDAVGISSDFGGGGGISGWQDATETPNVTEELRRRGYTEEQIAKLWSGNLLRVWREVERVAASLSSSP